VIKISLVLFLCFGNIWPETVSAEPPRHDAVPSVIDLDWSTLKAMRHYLGLKDEQTISDATARELINFRYVFKSGTKGVIFQATYASGEYQDTNHRPDDGTDESFRIWGSEAARAGLLVGAYHYYHPVTSKSPEAQADFFIDHIIKICTDHASDFRGKKILLAFEADHEENPSLEVDDIVRFARQVHLRTKAWPGFYPETGRITGLNTPIYYKAFGHLDPDKKRDLAKCWLWGARYSPLGLLVDDYSPKPKTGEEKNRLFYGIWPNVTLWQYAAAESWMDDEASATGYTEKEHFPISAAGSVVPFDCNYISPSLDTPQELWQTYGWMPLP